MSRWLGPVTKTLRDNQGNDTTNTYIRFVEHPLPLGGPRGMHKIHISVSSLLQRIWLNTGSVLCRHIISISFYMIDPNRLSHYRVRLSHRTLNGSKQDFQRLFMLSGWISYLLLSLITFRDGHNENRLGLCKSKNKLDKANKALTKMKY